MKTCAGCGQPFPAHTYYVKTRYPDGTVRSRHSRCGICRAEERMASRRRLADLRNSPIAVEAEGITWLPVAPFRAWLWERLARDQQDITSFAARIDVEDRQVRRWLHESHTVDLDHVDRVLCRLDDPGALALIYPELYEFADERAAA